MFKTELGNGIIDRPLNQESAAITGLYTAILTDADMHKHESSPFAPSSATDFFLWEVEVKNHARLLGHHKVTIVHDHAAKRRTVAEYARYRGGVDWHHLGLVAETEILNSKFDSIFLAKS
jgi:hypothetical protein